MLCLYGDEAGRQVGRSTERLQEKLDKLTEVSQDLPYASQPLSNWRPYGSTAHKYYKDHIKKHKFQHF